MEVFGDGIAGCGVSFMFKPYVIAMFFDASRQLAGEMESNFENVFYRLDGDISGNG